MKATFQTFLFGTIIVTTNTARFLAQNYLAAVRSDGTFQDSNGQQFRVIWPTLAMSSPDAVLEVVVTQIVGRSVPQKDFARRACAVA